MGVRENRLSAEYNIMRKFRSNVMKWENVGAITPPDIYMVTYDLTSIIGFSGGEPQYHKGFKVEIRFPLNYPQSQPEIHLVGSPRPLHPNIFLQDGRFCLEGSQEWIPGLGVAMDLLCQMMGEIISYQIVNVKNPANANLSLIKWIEANPDKLPVDSSPIRLPDSNDEIHWGDTNLESTPPRIKFG